MTLFANAKTVPVKAPKNKKPEVETLEVEGLEDLAAIDAVIKSLTAMKSAIGEGIKTGHMTTHFVEKGIEIKKRPANYRGTDGAASASLELRNRASNINLTEAEQELCEKHNIPTVTNEETTETFIFNPIYLTNGELMGKIEAALKKVKGLPEDIIMRQPGVTTVSLDRDALDVLFTKEEAIVRDLLPVLGVLAIKPTQELDNLPNAFARVHALVVPPRKEKAKA